VDSFLLALLLVFVLALGGRDQRLVAQLSEALGPSALLLAVGCAAAAVSAGVMAWLGSEVAALLPRRAARMLVAFALGFAALELALPVRLAPPREPTRSLGALAIVLFARQLGDAARFGVFALAAGAALPLGPGLGGALGGAGALALGWSLGAADLARWPLAPMRRLIAGLLFVAAILIGLNARYALL
jgi:putative Ca2+/H+ antiporter (TMEM165/GDT1 family)